MNWNGKLLVTKEDWAEAMVALGGPAEAHRFADAAIGDFGLDSRNVLGYLTGDIHPDDRGRVQELLGVEHPFAGLTPQQLFDLGHAHGTAIRTGDPTPRPSWLMTVYNMPRRTWYPFFKEPKDEVRGQPDPSG